MRVPEDDLTVSGKNVVQKTGTSTVVEARTTGDNQQNDEQKETESASHASSAGSSSIDSDDDEPMVPEKSKISKGKAPLKPHPSKAKTGQASSSSSSYNYSVSRVDINDVDDDDFIQNSDHESGSQWLHIEFEELENERDQAEREKFYKQQGFNKPPFDVTREQEDEWRHYHIQKVIDGVLNGTTNDLKALIDIEFIENLYERGRQDLNQKRENLVNRWIMLKEKLKLLENWHGQASRYGAESGLSWEAYVETAKLEAKKRMLDDFVKQMNRVDSLSTAQREIMEQEYSNRLDVMIANDAILSRTKPAEVTEEELRQMKAEIISISDASDADGSIHNNGELGKIENAIASMRDFFYPLQDRDGVIYRRYFGFIMSRVNEKIKISEDADYASVDDIPYRMPEPYRSFLMKFNEANNLNELAKNYPVPPDDIKNNNEDLGIIRNNELSMDRLEREIQAMGMVGEIVDTGNIDPTLLRHKARLKQEIFECRQKIIFTQNEISKRFYVVALSIFIKIFCRYYAVFVKPNYIMPDKVVEENNRLVRDRRDRGIRERNDHQALLENGDSLLMAAIKRKYYPMAAWLMLCGANPALQNQRESSAIDLLSIDDIAELGVLASKIDRLIHDPHAEPEARAQRYRKAREEEYIKYLEYQEESFTDYHKHQETRKAIHQNTFVGKTDALAKRVHKRLAADLLTLSRSVVAGRMWGSFSIRLTWYFHHGVISFVEIIQRVDKLRNNFRDLLTGLKDIEAIGYDTALVEKLIELERICSVTLSYEDIALQIREMLEKITQPAAVSSALGTNSSSDQNGDGHDAGSNNVLTYVRRREDIKDIHLFPKAHKKTREEIWAWQEGWAEGQAMSAAKARAAEARATAEAEARIAAEAQAQRLATELAEERSKNRANTSAESVTNTEATVSLSSSSQQLTLVVYQPGGGQAASRSARVGQLERQSCNIS